MSYQEACELIRNEVDYLSQTLIAMLKSFKSQITCLVQMQEEELATEEDGIAIRSQHQQEMELLKQRQLAVITYLQLSIQTLQRAAEDSIYNPTQRVRVQ